MWYTFMPLQLWNTFSDMLLTLTVWGSTLDVKIRRQNLTHNISIRMRRKDIYDVFKLKKASFGLNVLYKNIPALKGLRACMCHIQMKEIINVSTLVLLLIVFVLFVLELVSCWRDPQLQVSENYSDLTKWRSTLFRSCWLMSHFIFNMFNPLSPYDALKHHFTSLKTDLIFLQSRVLERKFTWNWFTNTW